MPRTADHDERRRQVAEALLCTGPAMTTFVDVADELGASVGPVQRHFRQGPLDALQKKVLSGTR
ncbi:hypothetical protein H4W79_004582 [Nocardiopsis terrae]|uniref:Transcriptional regulator, TetR family n=1 Tax=Nocardiopsis terrae TaxID=372655 RepID=A0ABR9HMX0_9ACTN|nr:hypothetical protein [Nocardiopsis terrae]MBE1460368.1 hypothetical protein [Nocardiopsis terrae]